MAELLDNYDLWERHDRERERELKKFPKCDCCGEPITDDYYYDIDGDKICKDCLDKWYRVENDTEE